MPSGKTAVADGPRGLGETLRTFLFHSEPLPETTWRTRHRFIRCLAAAHVPVLAAFGIVRGYPAGHVLLEAGGLAATVALAGVSRLDRRTKEALGTLALMLCSALLVHLAGGSIEAHFHFFVMLPVVALYQSWFAFILGIGFVVLHHGALGTYVPGEVYNHEAAWESPWLWAGVHGLFVSFAAIVYVIQWRLNELARNDARTLYRTLYEGQSSLVSQLEEASTMKDELVSTVSHELRTPLTSIIGHTEIFEEIDEPDPVATRAYVRQVGRQAARLKFLIENLMNYQRADQVEAGVVGVASIVDEVLTHQSAYPGADKLSFRTDVQPGILAGASDRALRLIVSNLLNNAVKYATPGTEVYVAARCNRDKRKPAIEISVSNEGQMISNDDRERIFGAFVQLDASSTRSVSGVGLGLHIVGRTVTAYDGTIDLACENGRITFTVTLPAGVATEQIA